MGINIKDFIESLELPDGGFHRSDCPVCSGHNSFTVTNEDSFLMYNCYKLSCDLGGAVPINLTAEEIALKLNAINDTRPKVIKPFEIPEYIVTPRLRTEYAQYNRYLRKYELEFENVMYDVKGNRAVFLIQKDHKIIDAIGRSLDNSLPKWYRYTGLSNLFSRCVGEPNGVVVVVEDVVSAITVAKVRPNVTGMALLGTNLEPAHTDYLNNFTKIIVALDNDATDKGLEYRKEIHSKTGINTVAIMLQDDLKEKKEYDLEQLKEYTQ